MQVEFDQRAHFRGMPVSFFWILWPSEWKVMHLARFAGFLKNRKRGRQHPPLSIPIPHLPDRAPIGKLDGGRAWNADGAVEFMRGGQHQGGKALFFEVAGGQSHGLAAERSGRCEQHGADALRLHAGGHRRDGPLDEFVILPLEPVEGV